MTSPTKSAKNVRKEIDLNALADRLFAAFEAGDMDAIGAAFAPEARIWHNFTNAVQSHEEHMQTLGVLATLKNLRYEDVRRRIIDGGFIQQHTIHGEVADGQPFEVPAIMIVKVRDDGKITGVEEYLDPKHLPFPR